MMWETEREFELDEEVQDYELEDEGNDTFADLEFHSSADKEDKDSEFEEDFYDDEDPDYQH